MSYTHLIREHYPKLTKSEKKVADFILSAQDKVIYSTISDVKKNTGVGDATIIRFCQKLGFSGFSDLKIEIAKENFNHHEATDQTVNFADVVSKRLVDAVLATQQLINIEHVEAAVKLVTEAQHIYIFGVGSSGNTSTDLEGMFLRAGVQAKAVIDPHFQAQVASLLTKDDLVIAFSLSGKTKDTHDSVTIAKQNHAKIISITNYLLSPIAQQGDVVLQTAIEEFLNGGSLAGKVSQLYLCDVLVNGYERANQIDTLALKETVLRSILDKSLD
ncbi:MurR/RpiR family transcriptional regulator [Latilactobacillus fuchuensis]|jgi:DNA-binding MurR/RpiR family transcriptional regulator|uniref:RpiR family phosphosugar-binding transcriptional regulator n=1 Tax=Latilactobacillus fuchuensis DSM 14340 = JCM 11249 TaxID=1423747 RepID=A0A0R1RQI3_9LACO|nr:MurR/RpiR family transcriptional regulator [Latilactobacillus fuchuensis]KRL59520.1 RpiR family phosphosugar-binding transcriptional regulator [Latilactobacillus fuchuensis DSM 14340 = JCM 11249]MCP8858240.1 MurR/RpiR family transcriptional regulator [Latilactobacillus fuchuensis]